MSRVGNSQSRKKSTCFTTGLEKERPGKGLTRRQFNYFQENRQVKREDVPRTLRTPLQEGIIIERKKKKNGIKSSNVKKKSQVTPIGIRKKIKALKKTKRHGLR